MLPGGRFAPQQQQQELLDGATDAQRDVILRELARYKARRAAKQAEREADLRRFMDRQRGAMRSW